jgi:hypothetical protein
VTPSSMRDSGRGPLRFSCCVPCDAPLVPAAADAEVHPGFALQPGPSAPLEFSRRARRRERFLTDYPIVWLDDPAVGILSPFWIPRQWCGTCLTLKPGTPAPRLPDVMTSAFAQAGILVKRQDFIEAQHVRDCTLAKAKEGFAAFGYCNISRLLHPLQLAALARYYRELADTLPALGDAQCPLRFGVHNEPLSRFLHDQLLGIIRTLLGRDMVPSYTYFAGYREGAVLERHTDREQCEVTLNLLLRYQTPAAEGTPWPLHIETPQGKRSIVQHVGDVLAFRGRILPHWRDPLPPGHQSDSLLLHYVAPDFNGPLQ